jgi:hypothetical protein
MLVHDFAYVDAPVGTVRARLLESEGTWLGPLAAAAAGDGEALRIRIGPAGPIPGLSRTTLVELGEVREREGIVAIPMLWRASSAASAVPVLTADVEVAPLGPDRTQLTLMGRYEPPFGRLGERLDALLFHRIAEASVRSFLRRIADALAPASAG